MLKPILQFPRPLTRDETIRIREAIKAVHPDAFVLPQCRGRGLVDTYAPVADSVRKQILSAAVEAKK